MARLPGVLRGFCVPGSPRCNWRCNELHGSRHRAPHLCALVLAIAHGFTSYDATYVALATRVGATVVTNDRRMRQFGAGAGLPIVAPSEMS
jgi:predicted nucleic acid-binding protein